MHLNQITLQCTDFVYFLEFDSMLFTQIRKKEYCVCCVLQVTMIKISVSIKLTQ